MELKLAENMLAAEMLRFAQVNVNNQSKEVAEGMIVSAIKILSEKLEHYPYDYVGRELIFITGQEIQL
ncbi:hypothetical protein [Aquibacillus rhizosphaerae]|uniref:Uncharacterized protein n=1 Tax=Aquibacillus rhizosphaerae TaxID=3051431 RepID=A0ABT7LE23_9BACI|nr:hypothetical protein [Aquibacillus sp. LR5S19]MDL4842796.1 hypothetical protein [Aquibacillus sp. LR5S19]